MYLQLSKADKVIFFISSVLLAIVYLLEFQEECVKENFPSIILFIVCVHWVLFIGGWMLVGFPLSYILKSIVKKLTPKKSSSLLEESRKEYPFPNYVIDMFWWTVFLPASFGGIIIFLILFRIEPASFDILYYVLPFGGIIYISFKSKFDEIMGVTLEGEES